MMSYQDVTGIGALNVDLIYEIKDYEPFKGLGLPLEAGREVIAEGRIASVLKDLLEKRGILKKVLPGGSASNTCHMLAKMGYITGLIGVIGDDLEGEFYLEQTKGVDTSGIIKRGGATGKAYIINTEAKDRSIILFPGSNSAITLDMIYRDGMKNTKWVHMTSFVTEEAMRVQMEIKSRLMGKVGFSIDPGEVYARMGDKLYPLIEGVDILFISEKECEMLYGRDLDAAIQMALKMAKIVVLKRGKMGASVYAKDLFYTCKAEDVWVVDNTGAGDVLNGVFLGLYSKGASLDAALRAATRAASISTTGYGRDAYPDRDQISLFVD